jgi:4-diphosphocytidyl-2-C-methyl-D-erythritol kinase
MNMNHRDWDGVYRADVQPMMRESERVAAAEADSGTALRIRVPAKLNLFLAVRGSRSDGFHELITVFQTVSVHDELRVGLVGHPGRRHHPAGRRRMRLELWADSAVPHGRNNLAFRAALLLGELSGINPVAGRQDRDAVRTILDLDKRIPVAAGMAGGSADAAAALIGLNRLWGCGLTLAQLRSLGAQLGSDVPFCMTGGTALGTGRGTDITPVLSRGPFHWVVWPDSEPLSTQEVYRAWDRHCAPADTDPEGVLFALRSSDPRQLAAVLSNELEPAAFALRPRLVERRRRLLEAGALGVVVAGSGPTLLALAADHASAVTVAQRLEGDAVRPIVASSPAGGPQVTAVQRATETGPLGSLNL